MYGTRNGKTLAMAGPQRTLCQWAISIENYTKVMAGPQRTRCQWTMDMGHFGNVLGEERNTYFIYIPPKMLGEFSAIK